MKPAMAPRPPCEICGGSVNMVLDHDHVRNEIRGWLCNHCNLGIGWLGEDVSRLQRAIEYLSKPPTGMPYSRYRHRTDGEELHSTHKEYHRLYMQEYRKRDPEKTKRWSRESQARCRERNRSA